MWRNLISGIFLDVKKRKRWYNSDCDMDGIRVDLLKIFSVAIYAVLSRNLQFMHFLCREKLSPNVCLWGKNDRHDVCSWQRQKLKQKRSEKSFILLTFDIWHLTSHFWQCLLLVLFLFFRDGCLKSVKTFLVVSSSNLVLNLSILVPEFSLSICDTHV